MVVLFRISLFLELYHPTNMIIMHQILVVAVRMGHVMIRNVKTESNTVRSGAVIGSLKIPCFLVLLDG